MSCRRSFLFIILALYWGGALAAEIPSGPRPAASDETLAEGAAIYLQRCSFCHGLLGDGNGPAAEYLDPRPRDFTLGTFKFRTTQSGELPRDEDLFRTVSRGLSGTAMQAFDSDLIKNGLAENERWAVIDYIKSFAIEFEDPELDPTKNGLVVTLPQERPPYSEALVAKGKEVFEHAKCWECHGKLGRGDGQESFDRTDDWGFPIRIRNVTHPWKIKAGIKVEDIYMRFSTGVNGTPMPSFVDALSEEERWALANFIKSLQHQLTDHQVLKAKGVEGEILDDPTDVNWAAAEPMDVRLTGQVIAAPRWQNPSIEMATVRALYNENEIAFLIQWDDPFKDVTHQSTAEFNPQEISRVGGFNSYVAANGMVPRQLETFRDAIALQFPVKLPEGTKKPHFFRGDSSNPVHLWQWQSDLAEAGTASVKEFNARGWKQPTKLQVDDQQQVTATANWDQGRWSVIMRRPLLTDDRNDIQFIKGQFIPLTLNAWDGSNGEHGLVMSLSTWHSVILEAPIPLTVYLYTLLAVLVTGALGFWLARKEQARTGPGV
jgi:DMSO reductase family type II enzyme heme b subunit|tara:strand:+ start:1003 stop:2640 length:1638 start_codon:yes stop_codon:yes gene_type:complete